MKDAAGRTASLVEVAAVEGEGVRLGRAVRCNRKCDRVDGRAGVRRGGRHGEGKKGRDLGRVAQSFARIGAMVSPWQRDQHRQPAATTTVQTARRGRNTSGSPVKERNANV